MLQSHLMKHGHEEGRIVTLTYGGVLVVTDLHGDSDAYRRSKALFNQLQREGKAERIVYAGDLVHSYGPAADDGSLEIVLDLILWQEMIPGQAIVLLGNHELPHLYSFSLYKGDLAFSPRFEAAMGAHRERIIRWLHELPLFVRTAAGVAIAHAGAGKATAAGWAQLTQLDHKAIWLEARNALPAAEWPALRARLGRLHPNGYLGRAREELAVTGRDDPRYDDLLISYLVTTLPIFELIWDSFFTQNEHDFGARYESYVASLLAALGCGFGTQNVLVSGHIACEGGFTVVNSRQLRLASAAHASPREKGRCLLFDAGRDRPVSRASELVEKTIALFAA